jgi:hypothetical protein
MKTLIAAVALATAIIASPAFAQSSEPLNAPAAQSGFAQVQPGAPAAAQRSHGHGAAKTSPYNAYNAVTPFGSPAKVTNTAREQALRECSTLAGAFKENTWGSMQIQQYRSCMAQRGQAE